MRGEAGEVTAGEDDGLRRTLVRTNGGRTTDIIAACSGRIRDHVNYARLLYNHLASCFIRCFRISLRNSWSKLTLFHRFIRYLAHSVQQTTPEESTSTAYTSPPRGSSCHSSKHRALRSNKSQLLAKPGPFPSRSQPGSQLSSENQHHEVISQSTSFSLSAPTCS